MNRAACGLLLLLLMIGRLAWGQPDNSARQQRVAERRAGVQIIVHRGVATLARENTLLAYRYALELGADGNEIDIRATRDGVLICFHDDMLDHHLDAFGDVSDYDWQQLKRLPFRRTSGEDEEDTIPTLEEVFQLHHEHGGLMHLDVKRAGLEQPIIELLDRMDLWSHVVAVNDQNAAAIARDPRYRGGRYKGSLYQDRAEFDPPAISQMLQRPGDMVIVDDPRGVLVALDREIRKLKRRLDDRQTPELSRDAPPTAEAELLAILQSNDGWDEVPTTREEIENKSKLILRRAEAAEEIRRRELDSAALRDALQSRVERRSVHPQWMYHGLDGACALRALAAYKSSADSFIEVARFSLWREDPLTESLKDPRWDTPGSWMDFRTKVIVFPLIEQFEIHTDEAVRLCKDYLALCDEEASRIGPLQFEAAARALLAIEQDEATAANLLQHRRGDVRGGAMIECLRRTGLDSQWARVALENAAPHALKYVVRYE